MTLDLEKCKKALKVLNDYEMSLLHIGEDSDAADREYFKILKTREKLIKRIKELQNAQD